MKAALLLFQVLPLITVAVDVDCFDNDEALELLQRRSSATAAQEGSEKVILPPEGHHETVATWLLERIQKVGDLAAKLDSSDVIWLYGFWPSLLALGLPVLASGGGLIQVLAFAVFWLLLRPCASMLEVIAMPNANLKESSLRALGFTAETMTLAAHFYWCWGLFELVVRRRSLLQRLLAVSFLWLLFVPIPFAQIYLGRLELYNAVATALLGDVLGVAFFFSLRCTPSWRLIQAMHLEKGGFVHENLTTFWGGCSWPASQIPGRCCKALEALTNPPPFVHDFSEDEDFTVRRMEVCTTSPKRQSAKES